jgi:hypothetical protein
MEPAGRTKKMKAYIRDSFLTTLVCFSSLVITGFSVAAQECLLPSTLAIESSQGDFAVSRGGQTVIPGRSGALCIGDSIAVTGDGRVTLRDAVGQEKVLLTSKQSPFAIPLPGTVVSDADSDDRCIGCARKVGQAPPSEDEPKQDAGSPARSAPITEGPE